MFAGSAFVYRQESSKQHHNKTDANTLNPKIHRTIPNTLSKAHQRRPAASQLYPTRHLLCCYLVRRPLQLLFQKTKTCLLPCSSSKLYPACISLTATSAFKAYTSPLYSFHKPLSSSGYIINYYRVLTGSNIPPALANITTQN